VQVIRSTFKSPSPPLFLLGSSDEKPTGAADTGGLAIWSPGPGPEVEEATTVDSVTKPGAGDDDLEDFYAGVDSLVDTTTNGHAGSNVVEEDDPLAEFEAWIASGAVQIVDKL